VGDPFQTNPEHCLHHEVDALFALDQALQDAELLIEQGTTSTDPNTIQQSNKKPLTSYLNHWQNWVDESLSTVGDALPNRMTELYQREFTVVKNILSTCDDRFVIQLGNSMSVRYASWSGSSHASLFANRGTSGIDGSLSTAVGYAMANPNKHCVAILGDISAIYDAHALWTAELPKNFSVVLLNNRGGQIFNWIGGPAAVEDLMPLIETPQHYNFKHLCDLYQIRYARHDDDANTSWTSRFLDQPGCTLWEV
jgi:2-succinyl-5-enolpyruvyl-6-hydroxy-3-cyclohexene-1-carboxylate synthase